MSGGPIYDTRDKARRAVEDMKDEAIVVRQQFRRGYPKAVQNPDRHGWIIVTDPPAG